MATKTTGSYMPMAERIESYLLAKSWERAEEESGDDGFNIPAITKLDAEILANTDTYHHNGIFSYLLDKSMERTEDLTAFPKESRFAKHEKH